MEKAIELFKQGMSYSKIATELGLHRNKVTRYLKKMGHSHEVPEKVLEANARTAKTLKVEHRYVCGNCGKEFVGKVVDRNKYCSRECSFEARRAKPKPPKPPKPPATCAICGKKFKGVNRAKYCSDDCKKEKTKRDYKEKYFTSTKETNPYTKKKCKHCGKEFETNYYAERTNFCSKKCGKKNGKRQRRARIKGQFVEEVTLSYIYERDGGKCRLCKKVAYIDKLPPHPKAATLDHIIPLSRGGLHERRNVQLAHFICNSNKGDRGEVQPMLFG